MRGKKALFSLVWSVALPLLKSGVAAALAAAASPHRPCRRREWGEVAADSGNFAWLKPRAAVSSERRAMESKVEMLSYTVGE